VVLPATDRSGGRPHFALPWGALETMSWLCRLQDPVTTRDSPPGGNPASRGAEF
jgi:hypothetical protein